MLLRHTPAAQSNPSLSTHKLDLLSSLRAVAGPDRTAAKSNVSFPSVGSSTADVGLYCLLLLLLSLFSALMHLCESHYLFVVLSLRRVCVCVCDLSCSRRRLVSWCLSSSVFVFRPLIVAVMRLPVASSLVSFLRPAEEDRRSSLMVPGSIHTFLVISLVFNCKAV